MYKFYIILALVAVFVRADDEPFSIGLGVLSPSYSQTVGKENVKVNFEQKDNGFSYSVGDPASGTNTFLNFGAAAAGQAVNPAGYADASPSGYAGANPSAYTGPSSSGFAEANPSAYTGPSSGFGGIQSNPSYGGLSGFQSPSYGAGASSGLGSSGFGAGASSGLGSSGFGAGSSSGLGSSGFGVGSSSGLGSSGFGAGASSGLGASGFASGNGLSGSAGHPGLFNGPAAAPVAPSGFSGETARKPEENPSQILPAGFSYHGTEGQSFLRQGDSPNFVIDEDKESRGAAEQSFYNNFRTSGAQGSKKVLANGLVGYGPGGPRGNVPVGGFAGPQFSGVFKEHGGHD